MNERVWLALPLVVGLGVIVGLVHMAASVLSYVAGWF